MNKPHKHAALIKAWADGVEIQYKSVGSPNWYSITDNINWGAPGEFRIKPEKKKIELIVIETSKGSYWSCFYATEQKDKDNIEMMFPKNKYKRLKDWFEVEYEDE